MKKFKKLLVLFVLGVIALVGITYVHAYRFTHFSDSSKPRTDPKNLTILDKVGLIFTGIENPHQVDDEFPNSPFETFIIDGDVKLESWYVPNDSAKGLIIFYHGYAGNKSQMISRAHDLYEMGFSTAIVGFRGSGNSDGDYTTIGFEESEDVLNSYNFYKEKFPNTPIVLFGTSMGSAAILKAFENPELDVNGIIIEYPFGTLHQSVKNRFKVMGFPSFPIATLLTYFGGQQVGFNAFEHNPEEYAKKVNCPVLYFAGDKDDRVTNEETAEVFKNIASTDKQLFIFKNGGHENLNENFTNEWKGLCENFLTRVTVR